MLISTNIYDKSKSKYICDRCQTDINSLNRNAIYIAHGIGTIKKRWDLCRRLLYETM